ncbi:MAG: large repetitive protein, partial [Hyphomicrobiales bacterium]|nr:large repetitive protein [Hyphomicrobiales bacterium]
SFTVSAGALPAGLALNSSSGAISGTPSAAGSFSFTVLATDRSGRTGARAFTFAVTMPRSDPTRDPNVRGLVAAQPAAIRRFSGGQLASVGRRMESLHDRSPCQLMVGIEAFPASAPPTANLGEPAILRGMIPSGDSPELSSRQGAHLSSPCAEAKRGQVALTTWVSGTVRFGASGVAGGDTRFSGGTLTVGADGRFTDDLVIGGAVSYGTDRTSIDPGRTTSDAANLGLVIYGSYRLLPAWFIDGAMGYSQLRFHNVRFISDSYGLAAGNRAGASWFGSLAVSTELKSGAFRLVPYLRAEFNNATLKNYSEQVGSQNLALAYGDASDSSASVIAGMRGSYDVFMNWGMLTPTARLEYRRSISGDFIQRLSFADGAAPSYVLTQDLSRRDSVSVGLGMKARMNGGVTIDGEYGFAAAAAAHQHSVRASIRTAF